jgi:hypothetical protein
MARPVVVSEPKFALPSVLTGFWKLGVFVTLYTS